MDEWSVIYTTLAKAMTYHSSLDDLQRPGDRPDRPSTKDDLIADSEERISTMGVLFEPDQGSQDKGSSTAGV